MAGVPLVVPGCSGCRILVALLPLVRPPQPPLDGRPRPLALCHSGTMAPGALAIGGMTHEAGSIGTESAQVRAPLGTCPWCPLARVDAALVAGPGLLALARVAAGLSRARGFLEFLICRLPV